MNRLLTLIFIFLFSGLAAQEPMRVTRSSAIDRNTPITNIFVDANNNKWVGNEEGAFQLHTVDYAEEVKLTDQQSTLLKYTGGNFNLTWNTATVFSLMSNKTDGLFEGEQDISGAFYDPSVKELWIGTHGIGVFRFSFSGEVKLLEHINMDNSKLRTDWITVMYSDKPGSYWIGTQEGVLHNKGKKWKLYERYFNIEAISGAGADVWVFGEDQFWKVLNGEEWEPVELDDNLSEGKIKDIAFDSRGRFWIASEVITRYNPELGTVESFGAAEYFTSDFPSAVAVDQDDAIWVGTEDKGLYLIEKATAITISCILDKAPGCDSPNDAALKVVVSGGAEPYTFEWNDSKLQGERPKNIGPGAYSVTVTDNAGKSKISEITVNDPKISLAVSMEQPESGAGNADGIASVTVSGGQGNYSYKWDTGETSVKAEKLTEGKHSVTVTDKGGCSEVAEISISQNAAPLLTSIEQTQTISCTEANDGVLQVKIEGGRGPYQYSWSTTDIKGESPANVGAGSYEVTITDAEGTSATSKITVKGPEAISATINVESPASTGNADGKATISAKGGAGNYTYQWDSGESAATATNLGPGTRVVTITDAAGCTSTASVEISENILPLNASIEQSSDITCSGAATAAIQVKVNGGKGPYQFVWTDAGLSGENPNNLSAGNYEVAITDVEGNTTKANIEIKEPEALSATINVESPASTGNADGKATISAKGGAGNYTYQWDSGESAATATNLGPGTRVVTITDAAGCTSTASVEITENILPLNASIEQSSDIKCNGQATAAIQVKVNGGKGPYQFAWTDAGLSGENPNNLSAGNYEVAITDVEGNTTKANIEIKEPEALSATINVESPASTGNADGKATISAKGGAGNYTYQWDSGESAATATNLGPGTRVVTITDAAGCTSTASVEITENILPLNASIEQSSDIKCNGQATAAIQVKVNGGKGPYQFAWTDAGLSGENPNNLSAGNYEVAITDVEGNTTKANIEIKEPEALSATINVESPASTGNADGKAKVSAKGGAGNYTYQWDSGESAATATNLGPGTRVVTITDAAGCTSTASVEITENILPLNASIEQSSDIKCNGQATAAIQVKVNGGKGPYQFAWTDAGLSGENPNNLSAGNYEVTITDVEGTTTKANIDIKEPETLSASISVEASATTDNADGKATVSAKGGTGNYSFKWDNGENTATASKLAPGTRSVTVSDEAGCTTRHTVEITENILPLNANIEQTSDIKCNGEATAAIQVKVNGGKGPFQFAWTDSNLNGENPKNLSAGNYEVAITDVEGTTTKATIEIKEPETLSASISVEASATTDNADGKATVSANGGTGNYSFKWDNGESTKTASKLAPGTRSVTVTDETGCTSNSTIEITEDILPLTLVIVQTEKNNCNGEAKAALSTNVTGGKGPFQLVWNDASVTDENPSGLAAGDYEVTLTDALGTTATAKVSIQEPASLTAEIVENKACTNETSEDGLAKVNVIGGTSPYTIKWDNGEEGTQTQKLGIGNHIVNINDANGCAVELTFETKKKILPKLSSSSLRKGQTVRMEELFFEADSFRITSVSYPVLDELYEFLTENSSVVIEVGGHTNNIPEAAFCNQLSTARAKSVANYIVQKGIDPNRVYHKGYGKRKPIASNRTSEGRAKNQRVEIKILSI